MLRNGYYSLETLQQSFCSTADKGVRTTGRMFRNTRGLEAMRETRKEQVVILFLFLMTLIRIGLFVKAPFYVIGETMFDDYYQVKTAEYLLHGEWLGPYGFTTLSKGISFPLLLAAVNLIGMNYPFILGCFYAFSAALFCAALRKNIQNPWVLAFIYLFLLYSPSGFILHVSYRIYRNSVSYPSALLIMGCILGFYNSRREPIRFQLPWVLLLGFAVSFNLYLREDSIWIVPLVIAPMFLVVIWVLMKTPRREWFRRIAVMAVPLLIVCACDTAQRSLNQRHYGVRIINDRSSGSFAALTGNMMRIRNYGADDPYSWLTRDTYERILTQCPSLSEQKDLFLEVYDQWGANAGGAAARDGKNTVGDLPVWSFRDTMNRLGCYETAEKAEEFCRKANEELLAAVDRGDLEFDDAIHLTTLSPGIHASDLPALFSETCRNIWALAASESGEARIPVASGRAFTVDLMTKLPGAPAVLIGDFELSGWFVLKDENRVPYLQLEDENGAVLHTLEQVRRPEVNQLYPEYANSLVSGFYLKTNELTDPGHVWIAVYDQSQLIERIPVSETQGENERYSFYIEKHDYTSDKTYEYSRKNIRYASLFLKAGRLVSILLFPVSLILCIYLAGCYFRSRCWETFDPFIIVAGVLLTCFIGVFGTTLFTRIWMPDLENVLYYSGGQTAILNCFQLLSCAYGLNILFWQGKMYLKEKQR